MNHSEIPHEESWRFQGHERPPEDTTAVHDTIYSPILLLAHCDKVRSEIARRQKEILRWEVPL